MSNLSMLHFVRPSVYEYRGWTFEVYVYTGAWPLNKDGSPRKRAGLGFWKIWCEFSSLPGRIQEGFHVDGAPHLSMKDIR